MVLQEHQLRGWWNGLLDPGACPPPPDLQMNHTQEETKAVAAIKLHWTYRVLRKLAYTAGAMVFWAWVLFLALSGKF